MKSSELITRSGSTTNDIMAVSLVQESFEKIKYLKDKHIKKDSINWWDNFYTSFVLKSPKTVNIWQNPEENLKTYLKMQLDTSDTDALNLISLNLFDTINIDWDKYPTSNNPCNEDNDDSWTNNRIRIIWESLNENSEDIYNSLIRPENNGKFVAFAWNDNQEIIIFKHSNEEISDWNEEKIAEDMTFYRQMRCEQVWTKYNRNADEVLEFLTQINWEEQGIGRSIVMKMEIAK